MCLYYSLFLWPTQTIFSGSASGVVVLIVIPFPLCYRVLKYDMQNLEIPTISILGTLVKSGVRVLVYRLVSVTSWHYNLTIGYFVIYFWASKAVFLCSGDQDSVIPLLGTRSLVNGLAKDFGLNTTESYRTWFNGRQVCILNV